jgi:hypothetical protein
MKTKSFIVAALLMLPALGFGQNTYDDLYYNPKMDKAAVQKPKPQQGVQSNSTSTQYQIESAKDGSQDVVVVRNMDGDTVYYSGDTNVIPDTAVVVPSNYEYADRIQRFHNPQGYVQLNSGDSATYYPLDNVTWNVNVYGGYPYYGYYSPYSRYNPYYWGGYYSPWYSSWYDPFVNFGFDWDFGYGWGWDYPYYYGRTYAAWSHPFYSGGWWSSNTSHRAPYSYTAGSRRGYPSNGFGFTSTNGYGQGVTTSNTAGSRTSSTNAVGVRGSRQNTTFWNNFLTSRGYNVASTSSGNVRQAPHSSGGGYTTGSRSSAVVPVSSSTNNRRSSSSYTSQPSRSSDSNYNYNDSRNTPSRSSSTDYRSSSSSSPSYSSPSYSSGSRSSSDGGGSRGGGGGGRR